MDRLTSMQVFVNVAEHEAFGLLLANNGEMLCAAAVAGMSLCVLPTFICCNALRSGQLERVLAGQKSPPVGVYLVYPSRRLLLANVRSFINLVVGVIGDKPARDH